MHNGPHVRHLRLTWVEPPGRPRGRAVESRCLLSWSGGAKGSQTLDVRGMSGTAWLANAMGHPQNPVSL